MKRRLTLLTLVLFSVSTLMSMPGLAAENDGYVDAAGNQITPEIEPLQMKRSREMLPMTI